MQVQGEVIVRNNLLIDGKSAAFSSTDHQGKTINLQVVHNTLVNTAHAFRGGSWNLRSNMVLANNVIYSRKQNVLHFPNGYEGVTIIGNVVLGDGPKGGCRIGRDRLRKYFVRFGISRDHLSTENRLTKPREFLRSTPAHFSAGSSPAQTPKFPQRP